MINLDNYSCAQLEEYAYALRERIQLIESSQVELSFVYETLHQHRKELQRVILHLCKHHYSFLIPSLPVV